MGARHASDKSIEASLAVTLEKEKQSTGSGATGRQGKGCTKESGDLDVVDISPDDIVRVCEEAKKGCLESSSLADATLRMMQSNIREHLRQQSGCDGIKGNHGIKLCLAAMQSVVSANAQQLLAFGDGIDLYTFNKEPMPIQARGGRDDTEQERQTAEQAAEIMVHLAGQSPHPIPDAAAEDDDDARRSSSSTPEVNTIYSTSRAASTGKGGNEIPATENPKSKAARQVDGPVVRNGGNGTVSIIGRATLPVNRPVPGRRISPVLVRHSSRRVPLMLVGAGTKRRRSVSPHSKSSTRLKVTRIEEVEEDGEDGMDEDDEVEEVEEEKEEEEEEGGEDEVEEEEEEEEEEEAEEQEEEEEEEDGGAEEDEQDGSQETRSTLVAPAPDPGVSTEQTTPPLPQTAVSTRPRQTDAINSGAIAISTGNGPSPESEPGSMALSNGMGYVRRPREKGIAELLFQPKEMYIDILVRGEDKPFEQLMVNLFHELGFIGAKERARVQTFRLITRAFGGGSIDEVLSKWKVSVSERQLDASLIGMKYGIEPSLGGARVHPMAHASEAIRRCVGGARKTLEGRILYWTGMVELNRARLEYRASLDAMLKGKSGGELASAKETILKKLNADMESINSDRGGTITVGQGRSYDDAVKDIFNELCIGHGVGADQLMDKRWNRQATIMSMLGDQFGCGIFALYGFSGLDSILSELDINLLKALLENLDRMTRIRELVDTFTIGLAQPMLGGYRVDQCGSAGEWEQRKAIAKVESFIQGGKAYELLENGATD